VTLAEVIAVVIQVLLVVLIAAGIAVAVRLFLVLGDVHRTIKGVEETRQEVNATLKRVEVVVQTTDQVMREEIAPTLRVTRETLVHVENVTRALAETTQFVRRITGKAAPYAEAAPLIATVGKPVAELIVKQGSRLLTGFLTGLGNGLRNSVRGIFRPHKEEKDPPDQKEVKQIQGKSRR
jgi:hypothetical protein